MRPQRNGSGPAAWWAEARGRRSIYITATLALVLTLVAANVPGKTTATYPDIMGCEQSCEVAASGLPVPFIADYPGLSPVNSADLMGAILGLDRVLWGRAALAFAFWLVVSMVVVWVAGRVRTRGAV